MCDHRWKEDIATLHCFVGCVNTKNCDPRSHGAISYSEYCSRCGTVRRINKNHGFKEFEEVS